MLQVLLVTFPFFALVLAGYIAARRRMLPLEAIPGLNGFVGEFLILLGAFKVNKLYAAIGATGVIFAACYMLWMFQRVMFGQVTNEKNKDLPDLSWREIAYFAPLLLFIVWIGVYPNTFLNKTKATTAQFVAQMEKAKGTKLTLSHLFKGDAT